jgi:hypothetical protein
MAPFYPAPDSAAKVKGFDTVLARLRAETGKAMAGETAASFRISEDLVGAGRFERPTPAPKGEALLPKTPSFTPDF